GMALAFSQDGTTLASAGNDKFPNMAVTMWEVATGKETLRLSKFPFQKGLIRHLALSAEGKSLLVVQGHPQGGNAASLWDIAEQKQIDQAAVHAAFASHLVVAPDGKSIVGRAG